VRCNAAPAGDAGHPSWARAIERDDEVVLRAREPGWLADAEEMQSDTTKRRVTSTFERIEQFLIQALAVVL
jgi:hypothetical protein